MIRNWNEESLDHRNALLYAMGISEEDAKRPVIGLVNSWNEMNPGHFPFKEVIPLMKEAVYNEGCLALELPVSGVCDGICSNTPGDRYTLPARDLGSSEVEMTAELNMLEGMVMMATCDKVVPGMLMGALRVNIPAALFSGGYMLPGEYQGKALFTDIDSHWAQDQINRAVTLGWIRGYPDGAFRPDSYISRAEAVAVINRVTLRCPETPEDLLDGMRVWPDNGNTGEWYYMDVQEATNTHEYERKEAGKLPERWFSVARSTAVRSLSSLMSRKRV